MNKAVKDRILYWLRQAADDGDSGFMYDYDLPEEEQSEDWMYLEKMAIEDIEDFLDSVGISLDF